MYEEKAEGDLVSVKGIVDSYQQPLATLFTEKVFNWPEVFRGIEIQVPYFGYNDPESDDSESDCQLKRLPEFNSVEEGLSKVYRWSNYWQELVQVPAGEIASRAVMDKALHKGFRLQNVFQHRNSFYYTTEHLLPMILAPEVPYSLANVSGFDPILLLKAIEIHDDGEGLTHRDVVYGQKKSIHDLEEYNAVLIFLLDNFSNQPEVVNEYLQAFLLQFAASYAKKPEAFEDFPAGALEVLEYLADNYYQTALWFRALEHWGYLMYAVEQYLHYGHWKILGQVVAAQYPRLQEAAGYGSHQLLSHKALGFAQSLWTKDVNDVFSSMYQEISRTRN